MVLSFYGDKSPQWLSDLTHKEMPWQKAREGLLPNMRGSSVITLESMAEYYESLTEQEMSEDSKSPRIQRDLVHQKSIRIAYYDVDLKSNHQLFKWSLEIADFGGK